tara:strand:- start:10654 stop:12012 length:1359 start_codon:yes stop_codon:yes gene_type:complete
MAYLTNQSMQDYYDSEDYGNYQFVSLKDIINQFMFVYTGEDKIISKASRTDVAFHAQRALAELSFDTFRSCKSKEIVLPPTLQMILPQDYINYTKVSFVDTSGIKHVIYPTLKTSNPKKYLQNAEGDFTLKATGDVLTTSDTITLTTRQNNILVGMNVTGGLLPSGINVWSVKHESNSTIIRIREGASVFTPTTQVLGAELTFTSSDKNLIRENSDIHVVDYTSFSLTDKTVTFSSASDISNIEPGMYVYSSVYPASTKVVNVNSNILTVDQDPLSSTSTFFSDVNQLVIASSYRTDEDYKDSTTWENYKSNTPFERRQDDYIDDIYWTLEGNRYGIDPSQAQINGSFYIDCDAGKIHFSSNLSGETIVLDYISDGLGTEEEMKVHKYAEEAMYKCIMYSLAAGRSNIPEYQINRFKKERFASVRTAKLRLSNLKLEELTQVLRGKSKWIKH